MLDGTGFPKQGRASVGVQRQYSGTLDKIGNCQVAVTAALWTGVHAWLVGAQMYLVSANGRRLLNSRYEVLRSAATMSLRGLANPEGQQCCERRRS